MDQDGTLGEQKRRGWLWRGAQDRVLGRKEREQSSGRAYAARSKGKRWVETPGQGYNPRDGSLGGRVFPRSDRYDQNLTCRARPPRHQRCSLEQGIAPPAS